MNRNFKVTVKNRRTYYAILNSSPVSDEVIKENLEFAVKNVPSAFNSQSTRVVLLLNEQHHRLWEIVKEILQEYTSAESFVKTKEKIETCFQSGYGTVLFFEDQGTVHHFQKTFPSYKDNFPVWSEHTAGMHQFTIWTLLEDLGFGASLQHYNPLIDRRVSEEWGIDPDWKLTAQMPFGLPVEGPGEKTFKPLESRVLVFK